MSLLSKSSKLRYSFVIVLLLAISYSGYAYFFKKSDATTGFMFVNATVKKGNIENSVEVVGTSELVHEQKMRFNQTGKVTKISFKEGQTIKKGDIIAELDTTDVQNDIKQQELSLNNAEVKLAQTIKWPEAKDILNAENTVTSAESKITTLYNDRSNLERDQENKQNNYQNQIVAKQNDIKSNENDVENKLASLANTKNELAVLEKTETKSLSDTDTDTMKVIDQAVTDARKQIIDAEQSLYNADQILGITDGNRLKNDAYEMYLGAKDSSILTRSEADWSIANTRVKEAKSALDTVSSGTKNATNVRSFLVLLSKSLDALVIVGKDGSDVMNASLTSSSFSENDINSKASIFSSITSSAQSALTSVNATIVTIDKLSDPELKKATSANTISAKKQSVADQENAIQKLRDNADKLKRDVVQLENDTKYSQVTYEAQLKAKDLDIENAKNSLAYSKESLRLLKTGATKEEITLAKNSIAAQRLSLEKVKKNLTKYQLEAPFDGIVRKIDFQIGDNILSDEEKYVYIENPNLLEITVTVDQLEVVKLKEWQTAKIVFDSYPALTFTWVVSDINSTPTQTSGVTSYTVKVSMDKGKNAIFSGMSAKVDIIIEGKEDALMVGTSFVNKRNGKTTVLKKNGTENESVEVVTGISNATNTEIVSGLSERDTIVRRIATGTGSSTKTSLIPTGGNRSGTSGGSNGNFRSSWGGVGGPPGM